MQSSTAVLEVLSSESRNRQSVFAVSQAKLYLLSCHAFPFGRNSFPFFREYVFTDGEFYNLSWVPSVFAGTFSTHLPTANTTTFAQLLPGGWNSTSHCSPMPFGGQLPPLPIHSLSLGSPHIDTWVIFLFSHSSLSFSTHSYATLAQKFFSIPGPRNDCSLGNIHQELTSSRGHLVHSFVDISCNCIRNDQPVTTVSLKDGLWVHFWEEGDKKNPWGFSSHMSLWYLPPGTVGKDAKFSGSKNLL